MSRVTVISLSDSFGGLWRDLAADLGVVIDVVPSGKPVVPSAETAAVVLTAGGVEREAIQWLMEHPPLAGSRTLVVGADPGRRTAMQMLAHGARDYFALPDDLELLRNAVAAAVKNLRDSGAGPSTSPTGLHAAAGDVQRTGGVRPLPGV